MFDAVRHIPALDLTGLPWGNGAGIVHRIAIHPDDAGDTDFVWRVSVAEASAPGPFQIREDVDRILLLVEGGSLRLIQAETRAETTLEPGARLYFAGETPYRAELPAGPVRLFNLMLRRKQAHGCVDLRSSAQGLPLRAGDTLLHCARGRFRVRGLPPRLGGEQLLEPNDSLHISLDYVPAFTLDLTPLDPGARLVDARINRYPGAA